MEKKNLPYLKRFFGHLRTVITHKKWVLYYARLFGISKQGFIHDLSKFSPVEFFEGVKYWTGTSSPIVECKKDKGYSLAWLHHKGKNKHHFQYWMDYANGTTLYVKMPWNYVMELLADWYAAGVTYSGKDPENIYIQELEWWHKQSVYDKSRIHAETFNLVDFLIRKFAEDPQNIWSFKENKEYLKYLYETGEFKYLDFTEISKTWKK